MTTDGKRPSREMIKNLVRECLMEILQEGLGASSAPANLVSGTPRRKAGLKEQKATPVKDTRFENAVKTVASRVTANPLLQSLLEDSARTTYQEQAAQEFMSGKGAILEVAGDHAGDTPQSADIPVNGSSRWADLAFAPPRARPR